MKIISSLLLVVLLLSGCARNSASTSGTIDIEKRAEDYYSNANLDLAEIEYRKLLQVAPRYAKGWFKLGNIYLRTNHIKAAIFHYEKAVHFDEKMAKAWHNLALARIRQATQTLIEGQKQVGSSESFEINLMLENLLALQRRDKK